MATSTPTDWNRWLTDPLALGAAASGYLTDAWQRGAAPTTRSASSTTSNHSSLGMLAW